MKKTFKNHYKNILFPFIVLIIGLFLLNLERLGNKTGEYDIIKPFAVAIVTSVIFFFSRKHNKKKNNQRVVF